MTGPAGLELISSFEGGRLHRSGKINVPVLHGSYRRMGRQYGHLLSGELKSLCGTAVVDHFQRARSLSDVEMDRAAMSLYRFYPQRFKDMIGGMAETSGLSLREHIMLNAIEFYGLMSGCSGIIAWGDYAKGQALIAGRNYDWFEEYTAFAQSLAVTVFNPDSGIPNAIVTYAGVIYATTGLNAKGVFLELDNGLPSGGSLKYDDRVPAIVNLLAALTDCGSLDELDAFFNTTRTEFTFIVNAADRTRGVSYEWVPFEHRRRCGDAEGLLVSTNHFADPSWGIVLQDQAGFETVLRRENLLALGHERKGRIDPEVIKEIMDTPTNKGGAAWPADGSMPYRTTYQIVAEPASLQLWLKVPGFQDWTGVGLEGLFEERP